MSARFPLLIVATSLGALMAAGPAAAGDPCPIEFTFYDLGAPSWLDRNALLDGLASQESWVGIRYVDHADGVQIEAVAEGSPAAKVGLAVGQVIDGAAGIKVTSRQELAEMFRVARPGSTIMLRRTDGTEVRLTLGRQDPVLRALIDHASKQECSLARRGDMPPAKAEALRSKVLDERRFRCDDAHKVLAKVLEPGDIVLVRGSKRILLANPGWATVCVEASAVDGATRAAGIPRLFGKLARAYVADRHANP